ncbi:hypothetical protein PENANT_c019G11226, partial [Penicillium antarcticum]
MSAFLANEPAYNRYLEGGLNLPAYDTDQNGNIVLIASEVFCRVNGFQAQCRWLAATGNSFMNQQALQLARQPLPGVFPASTKWLMST